MRACSTASTMTPRRATTRMRLNSRGPEPSNSLVSTWNKDGREGVRAANPTIMTTARLLPLLLLLGSLAYAQAPAAQSGAVAKTVGEIRVGGSDDGLCNRP